MLKRTWTVLITMALVVMACTSGGSGQSGAASPSAGGGAASAGASASAPSESAAASPSAAESAGASAGASAEPSLPAPPVEGELLIWADEKRAAALEGPAQQFGEENGVAVRIEAIAKDIIPNFLIAHQAGEAPDLVTWAHDTIGNLVANGAIDPLTLPDPSAFDELAIQGMTFDGQLYGVPYSVENIALFRNTDLVPDAPETMEDLVEVGKQLVADGEAKEILALQVGQAGDAYHIYPLFASGGGSFFGTTPEGDPDPSNVTVDSEGSIAAGEKLKALGEQGEGALKTSIDDKNAIPLFFNGEAPFLISGPWAVADIEKAGTKYDISPIPPFADGDPAGPFIGVNGFYVASGGKNKTLAQEFATNFLTTDDVQVALYEAEPRRPALASALETVTANDPNIPKFQEASEGGTILPAIPEMGQVWGPFGNAEAAIVKGGDVQEILEAAAQAIRDGIGG